MRLFSKIDGNIDRFDRPMWFRLPFDISWTPLGATASRKLRLDLSTADKINFVTHYRYIYEVPIGYDLPDVGLNVGNTLPEVATAEIVDSWRENSSEGLARFVHVLAEEHDTE